MTAVNHLSHNSLARSTRLTYEAGIKVFLTFCSMYAIVGLPVPSEDLFRYFVAHCHCRLSHGYHTIRTTMAGVRFWYVTNGFGNPFVTCLGQPMLRLHWILRAVRKEQGLVKCQRMPITYAILVQFVNILKIGMFGPYLDLLMQAVCQLAFFGFLRCNEFTAPTAKSDSQYFIRMKDVVIRLDSVSIHIQSSKTDPFRQGQWVHLYSTQSTVCPVSTLTAYFLTRCKMGADSKSNSSFFSLADGSPLTRAKFVGLLKQLLDRAGYVDSGLSPHSFRKGAATSASLGHVPDHIIRHMGRWSSDCYQRYITPSQHTVRHAMRAMTQ
jgi:hypothetical protein